MFDRGNLKQSSAKMAESIEWKSISLTNETDYNPSFLEFNFKLLANLVF